MAHKPAHQRAAWNAAAQARAQHDEQVAAIRADATLSAEGRRRRLAHVNRALRQSLAKLTADDQAALERREDELVRAVFGTAWPGARDAALKAAEATSLDQLASLDRIAQRLDDKALAAAVAHRGCELAAEDPQRSGAYWDLTWSWAQRTGQVDQLTELCNVDAELVQSPSSMAALQRRVQFQPPVLAELRGADLDALADAAGPDDEAPLSATAQSMNTFLRSLAPVADTE